MTPWLHLGQEMPPPIPRRRTFSDFVPALLILGIGVVIFAATISGARVTR